MTLLEIVLIIIGVIVSLIILGALVAVAWPLVLGIIVLALLALLAYGIITLFGWMGTVEVICITETVNSLLSVLT